MNRIYIMMATRNVTNKWLAAQVGKDRATISLWKHNRRQPSLDTLFQIAKALECRPSELINDHYEHEEKKAQKENNPAQT